jgi:tripartite-type tricarboxylate transporter receptor subunit TctC
VENRCRALQDVKKSGLYRSAIAAAVLVCAGMPVPAVAADPFPSKVVRIIVPGAGGAIELLARVLATHLREPLGQPVIVENKPGAGGNIGLEFAAKAEPAAIRWSSASRR